MSGPPCVFVHLGKSALVAGQLGGEERGGLGGEREGFTCPSNARHVSYDRRNVNPEFHDVFTLFSRLARPALRFFN